MSDDKPPEGPDFTAGVLTSDIAEGGMLGGHVGDEAVLIARVDGALHAIGAKCTHYQAPLADGLIKDGAVRCPWHHACFSLTTGEAVGAPAFDPVARWVIETRGDTVFVTSKKPEVQPKTAGDGGSKRVVIIGGGAGGFAAAEMLRRKGFEGVVTLFSADGDAPYDRPNCSKDFLSGDAPGEWMPLRDPGWYLDRKIELCTRTEVSSIDISKKMVTTADGQSQPYDNLILATGGEPRRPEIPGLDGPNVYLLRTLEDARALIAAADKARRVAVIGASFIGLEAAAALSKRGLEVHVVAPEGTPFEKVLGAVVGRWAQGVHEKKGVVFHLGRKVLGYADGVLALEGGITVASDFVVLGTGVDPRTALAESAGLDVDDGVVVDDRLRAGEGVYAIGDIARYPYPGSGETIRVEHWVHAERQGQHVARAILGEDEPFRDVPFFWSAQYEQAFHYSGHAQEFDPPKVDGSVEGYDAAVRYEKNGKLQAVVTLNRDLESLTAEMAFEGMSSAPQNGEERPSTGW